MGVVIPILGAIGSAVTAGAATGAAAVAVGGLTSAAVVGGTAMVASSIGKSIGAKQATSAFRSNMFDGGSSDIKGLDGGRSSANRLKPLALTNTGSTGVLGNATIGRRSLLAT